MRPSPAPVISPRRVETFGLFAVIENRRTILPLKGVECDFIVVSGVAEVSMTQVFRQENKKPLDCEYLFPLPADASVYHCEADINGRTIKAQVRERQEARQLAAEKKAAGFRTALVESERDNLFTLSLGNVQPGDLVIVQLKYFQTLRSLAGAPSIEIPFCPGIRYIPGKPLLRSNRGKGTVDDTDQVPDASRITPVRIDAEHPDAAYVEVRGTLDGKFVTEQDVVSPSHPIGVQRTGDELRITLSDKGDVPDRDFVLRWTHKNAESVSSRVWMREHGEDTYALLEIRAPKQALAERAPVDFYFLVDRSGSMAGAKWKKAAEALLSCVKVLRADDRVMITFFESRYRDFAEGPLKVSELLEDENFQRIGNLGTGGGTEMRPALEHVLAVAARHSANRPRNLILITDAQIGNESAILEMMKTAPDLAVHCFGIDVALNDSLLLALCRQQGGTCHSMNPNDDIESAVTRLGQTLGQPILLDMELPQGWESADVRIPSLYAGQIHYLSARFTGGKPHQLKLHARTASSQPTQIEFQTQPMDLDAPYLHWCKSRIQRFLAESNDSAAVALSVQSNLICRLTAFVAWDESEKVEVATHELVQPSMQLGELAQAGAGIFAAPGYAAAKRGDGFISVHRAHREPETSELAKGFIAPDNDGDESVQPRKKRLVGLFEKLLSTKESVNPDQIELKRELSDICHRIGVADWEPLVKAIIDWIAAAKRAELPRRLEHVNTLLRDIKADFERIARIPAQEKQAEMDKLRAEIEHRLKNFVVRLSPGK